MATLYHFKDFELDLARRELRRRGQPVDLQPKVFAVLALLVQRAGEALGKDDFLEEVWSGRFVTENVLSRCIREIRKALGDDASQPSYIRTVRGHGYRFVAPVEGAPMPEDRTDVLIRLAVLPFQPVIADMANPALELGLTDTLINDLSHFEALVVRPLRAVLDALGNQALADPLALGQKLDVDVVVESRLQLDGNRLRLNTRAIRVPEGTALMAERFDADLTDLFDVQDQLSRRISGSLVLRLSGDAGPAGKRRQTRDLRAYQAYADGRVKLARYEGDSATLALEDFERALAYDPQYVEALIGVAEANDLLATLGRDPARYHERTRRAAEQAIKIDPGRARAYTCLGKVTWQYDWNWPEAERLLRQGTVLDPDDADALIARSDFLCYQRRFDEALEAAERAGVINPFSPWIQTLIAQALYMGGSVEAALEQARRTVELAPDFGFARFFLARSLFDLGKRAQAIAQLQQAIRGTGRDDFDGVLGYMLARNGDRAGAQAILERMQQSERRGMPVPLIGFVIVQVGLGDCDAAFESFRRFVEQRSWHALLLYADPLLKELRARPEGLAQLRAMDLPA